MANHVRLVYSLRFRFFAGSVLFMLVLLGLVTANTLRVLRHVAAEHIQVSVSQTAETLNLAIVPHTTPEGLDLLNTYFQGLISGSENGIVYIALLNEAGQALAQSATIPMPLPPADVVIGEDAPVDYGALLAQGVVHVQQPILLFGDQIGSLHFGLSANVFRQANNRILKENMVLVAGGLTLILLALIVLSLRLNRRFERLLAASRALAEGDYTAHAEEKGADEIAVLARAFNVMAEAVRARQEALEASERSMRTTLENTPNVAVQWYDEQGRVVMWNHASERLYGVSATVALGKTLDQLTHTPEDAAAFRDMISQIKRTGDSVEPYESTFRRADGTRGVILCTTFRIESAGGQEIFACMYVDITEQKRTEAELERRVEERTRELAQSNAELAQALEQIRQTQTLLVRSEKLASLGSIVAGVAHELNTPIGNALTMATSLTAKTEVFQQEAQQGLRRSALENYTRDAIQAAELIERNIKRAAELITGFKQVAVDQTSSQRRRFDLGRTLREVAATLRPAFKKTTFTLDVVIPELIEMDSYPGPLGQVLTNFVNNALLHAFTGRAEGLMRLSAERLDGDRVRLIFADDGVGIPPQHVQRIFDPFFTTRMGSGGSGLGLNIVYNIVTGLLGGEIQVHSQPGQGAVFEVELPLHAPTSSESAINPHQPSTRVYSQNSSSG